MIHPSWPGMAFEGRRRFARLCPGHPRLACWTKDVDAAFAGVTRQFFADRSVPRL